MTWPVDYNFNIEGLWRPDNPKKIVVYLSPEDDKDEKERFESGLSVKAWKLRKDEKKRLESGLSEKAWKLHKKAKKLAAKATS